MGWIHISAAERSAHAPRSQRFRRRLEPRLEEMSIVVERNAPPAVQSRDRRFRAALIAADVTAALLVGLVLHVVFGASGPGWTALLLPAIVPVVNTAMGLYRRDELVLSKNTLDQAPDIFQASTLAALLAYFMQSALLSTPLGAQVIALMIVSLTLLTTLLRLAGRTLARNLTSPERCLLVGEARLARRLGKQLNITATAKAEVVGTLPLLEPPRGAGPLAAPRNLPNVIADLDVHRVVISGDGAPPQAVLETIQSAKALGVNVSLVPAMFEVVGSSVAFDHIGGLTVLGVRRFGLSRRARTVKAAFDLVGSVFLILLFAPLLATVALAIRMGSKGPILFRQTRVGRDGRRFQMLKFRSMVADADEHKADLRARNEADGLFKIEDDPRVTRVGRFLRRTSLDELPQLFNVLRGEMSLVGPRPLVVDEDRRIEGFYRRRLHLTPGMTGPWQVAGSARIPLHDMQSIDYLYVANWSLWLDVKILLRTIPHVVLRRGQ
jgi:exopolysaccharide biosynthesis polyprenyl glycosylphosphotransferase